MAQAHQQEAPPSPKQVRDKSVNFTASESMPRSRFFSTSAANVALGDAPNISDGGPATSSGSAPEPAEHDMGDLEQWTWDQVSELVGLADQSAAAEEARTALIRTVFMHELNSSEAYQKYVRSQQERTGEEREWGLLAQQQEQANALAQCWAGWRASSWCRETYMTLTYAEHSRLAFVANNIILFAILWSVVMFCLETVPSIEQGPSMDWIRITNYVCLGIFTVEFMCRLFTCPSFKGFVTSPMNILDFAAIFPSYVEIILRATDASSSAVGQSRVLRVIRLLRVLRLLRMWPKFKNITVILDAVVASLDVLVMMGFLLFVLLISFAAIIFFIEHDDNPNIYSIPQAMYFIQTTLTTTGYGDVTPLTWQGRAVAGLLMLTAIVTLALPISVIGANFTSRWMDFKSMCGSAARSEVVWDNFRDVRERLALHHEVLGDVAGNFNAVHASVKEHMAAAQDTTQRARLLYLIRATKGKTAGWQQDIHTLHDYIHETRHHLGQARRLFEHLEVASSLCHMTRSDEFVPKLDRMHVAYKNLRKWFEEGVYMLQEVRALTDDITALRTAMTSRSNKQLATSISAMLRETASGTTMTL